MKLTFYFTVLVKLMKRTLSISEADSLLTALVKLTLYERISEPYYLFTALGEADSLRVALVKLIIYVQH